jgi:glucose-6-phosphate isomerase
MNNYAKVKDYEYLMKDMTTGAILNTDMTVVLKHKKRQMEIEKEERRETEINNLKNDISEIKQLLQALLKKD